MAVARTATLVDAAPIGASGRHLTLSVEPLGFVGGQYIIVDSGRTLPNGKAAKRAYSIASRDDVQDRIELVVKRVIDDAGGIASAFLHDAPIGASFPFSGPWGKYLPTPDTGERTLVLATDTGITAALGLVLSARFRALAPATVFAWLQPEWDSFLPLETVREMLPRDLGEVRFGTLPPIGDASRVAPARAILRSILDAGPLGQAFIAGDGLVNYALLDDLVAAGVAATRDSVESFFNMPKKST